MVHSSLRLLLAASSLAGAAFAQEPTQPVLPEVTVTATRLERDSFELPLSIDTINARSIHEDRPTVNLSESLNTVPGLVVQNRQNYAQDLQISSRGFGARSGFGVRGVRLLSDGIPATMPDGQGQAASFSLDLAERIEVLRGPFGSMYGNASGGVIQIFTADGPERPTVVGRVHAGSFETVKWMAQYGGQHGFLNVNVGSSVFRTEGYRDHSAARRNHAHGKFKLDAGRAGVFTLIADTLDQPGTQDPLGLTKAQVAQNPRQAPGVALQFDTRKNVTQSQLGLVHDLRLGARDTLQARLYGGDRQVRQYLSIPLFIQAAPTHSGGVVDLDRGYGGAGVRWSHATQAGGTPLDVHVGIDYERMAERRRGFLNIFGTAGSIKRDERDSVQSTDIYAQAEWRLRERLLVLAGVRHSRLRFKSQDDFVAPGNPDDSGAIHYVHTSPVVGATFDVTRTFKVYANAGKGFETPTFAELAYRPDGSPGLNFALRPSRSWHREAGVKVLLGDAGRLTVAVFRIDVSDEIVVASASGGRTAFKNAPNTQRKGFELAWQGRFGDQVEAALAYTRLDAEFVDPFTTSTPTGQVLVQAGSRLPGVPANTLYGELVWRHAASGFHAGAEVRHNARVYVNDANSESASAYTVGNLRLGFEQHAKAWRLAEYVRVDNITGKEYVGSVIVADANQRFYEPAPRRNWLIGVSAQLAF